jgi:hypothetical protein
MLRHPEPFGVGRTDTLPQNGPSAIGPVPNSGCGSAAELKTRGFTARTQAVTAGEPEFGYRPPGPATGRPARSRVQTCRRVKTLRKRNADA